MHFSLGTLFLLIKGLLLLTQDCTANVQRTSCTNDKPVQNLALPSDDTFVNLTAPTSAANFPANDVSCHWKVTAPVGYVIRLNFTSMRLSDNCSQAYVDVRDRSNVQSAVGVYCGRKIPQDVLSESGLIITFRSTSGVSPYGGFSAILSAEPAETCFLPDGSNQKNNTNIKLKGTNGIFLTPKFPQPHPPNVHCRWLITVPSGYRVKLTFQRFQLGGGSKEHCNSTGMVLIRDSYSEREPNKAVFCGGSKPRAIYSNGRLLMVTFKSGDVAGSQGFRAHFEAVTEGNTCVLIGICSPLDQNVININLTSGASGSISNPDFPLKLPATAGCFWRFVAPPGFRIRLRFTSFYLHGNCGLRNQDGVWIQVDDTLKSDISGVASQTRWGRFCGNERPPTLYSTQNKLQVFFTSNFSQQISNSKASPDSKHGNEGFYMTYDVVKQEYTSRCRTGASNSDENVFKITEHSGILVSPGYPLSSPAITCHWKIIVPENYILELDVQDFQLGCESDSKLRIRNQRYCDSNKPDATISTEEDLSVRLTVTAPQFHSGFRAKFTMTEKEKQFSSIVPWIIIPLVLLAVGVTLFVSWRRRQRQRANSTVSITTSRRLTFSELVSSEELPEGAQKSSRE